VRADRAAYYAAWHLAHREDQLRNYRTRYLLNRDEVLAQHRADYAQHRQERVAKTRAYRRTAAGMLTAIRHRSKARGHGSS